MFIWCLTVLNGSLTKVIQSFFSIASFVKIFVFIVKSFNKVFLFSPSKVGYRRGGGNSYSFDNIIMDF